MFKVLTCLVAQHDLRLVLVAGLVCFCGAFTSFRLYSRMGDASGVTRGAWLLLTGLVAGCAVWATHFIAMLAFETGLRSGFTLAGTLASLGIAGVFMAAAFGIASAGESRAHRIAGGVLAGTGVAAMHFTGMAAYVTQGVVSWDLGLVAAALALGVGLGVAAMLSARRAESLAGQLRAGLILTVGICALHFTAMGAVSIIPDASQAVPPQLVAPQIMVGGVAGIVALIILGGLCAALIEGGANAKALARTRRLANAAYEGIVVVRANRITDANAAFSALVGLTAAELEGRLLLGELLTFSGEEIPGLDERREATLRPANGEDDIPVEVFGRLLEAGGRDEDQTVLAVRDLRERRAAEERIRFLADHDALTALPNRNALQTRLAATLERVAHTGESLAVICIDLDHFKEANDTHGHAAGDAILVEVARRLTGAISAPSFAARLGGDEFVVVQVGGEQPAAAGEFAASLLETLARPTPFEGQKLGGGGSLGVSLYPDDGRTGEALLTSADMALYRAKQDGRGAYRFFKREMDVAIRERRGVARELKTALAKDQLVLHYQPLAAAQDGSICGFEALVRWRHPKRGMVPPLDFIPIAEESGLILPIGEWVLRRACADAASWEKPLRIAVNLSPIQLNQPDLPQLVHQVLIDTGLSPQRLELEITESALFRDYQRALDNLRRLKALGVRIAMDDFGTGFSSLSTLQSFPFDKIKIDKSFVENILHDDRSTVIVRAVLGLGRSLEIPVTAEGVETPEQLEFLRAEACAEVQGYAIGRPSPFETLADWTGAEDVQPRRDVA